MNRHQVCKYYHELILSGILMVAGVLYLWNLTANGFSNTYYAAAVHSMLTNPTLTIWGAFDSAGFVTVDKPPVALWIQMASSCIFGYAGWALILPQALAGIGSVILLYLIISRSFGKSAGLIAAFVLTITPISVAVCRTNNLDGLLVFVLLVAGFTAIEAWKRGSLPFLLTTALLVGIGFNIKMIEAFAVVPAFFGIYLLSQQIPLKIRLSHLLCASIMLMVVSFSWAALVDLTPVDQRPYIGSSEDNSALELIFGYNGLSRIIGGPGQGSADGMNRSQMTPGQHDTSSLFSDGNPPSIMGSGTSLESNRTGPVLGTTDQGQFRAAMISAGMGRPDEAGVPGFFRLMNQEMAGQISWLLAFALLGALVWMRRPSLSWLRALTEQEVISGLFLAWIIPELIYFSISSGHFHLYYLVMVAPPLAALVGIGAVRMYEEYIGNDLRGWLLVLAIPVTGICQAIILLYDPVFSGLLPWIVLLVTILIGGVLATIRVGRFPGYEPGSLMTMVVIATGIGILLIGPTIWALTPLVFPGSGNIPTAGPDLIGDGGIAGGIPGMGFEDINYPDLITYLQSHMGTEKFLVGVESANSGGSELIVRTGDAVMAIKGFSGRDTILTKEALMSMIRQGDIRYFFVSGQSGGMPGNSGAQEISWIPDSCDIVTDAEWNTNITKGSSSGPNRRLYDCLNASG